MWIALFVCSLVNCLSQNGSTLSSRKRSYNTDEAVFAILADDDSDNETL